MTSHVPLGARIRAMRPADLDGVRAIVNHWIERGVSNFDTEPWTPDRAAAWLEQASARNLRVVAELDGAVAAWAATDPFRPKPAYVDAAELSVYVAPERVGSGLGRALCDSVVERLRAGGAHRMYAVVADHAPASTRLMAGLGMRHVGTLSEAGHKHGRRIDVDLWELSL